jgi:iduronate 2-sulfatase
MNTKDYHYIEWYKWDAKRGERLDYVASELYDRINDPFETRNLGDDLDYAATIKSLSSILADGWEAAGPD